MKQKSTIFVLLFLTALSCCMVYFKPVKSEKIIEKKLVYVVLDDSSSMVNSENRWPKAQYALEVLAGMLNPEDRLVLHFLNENYKDAPAVTADGRPRLYHKGLESWEAPLDSSKNIQRTMRDIKEISSPDTGGLGTFITAVDRAFNEIKDVSQEQDCDFEQFWLVILTDGALQYGTDINKYPGKRYYDRLSEDELLDEFEYYVNEPFGPDGTKRLQLVYCTFGTNKNDDKTVIKSTERLKRQGIYTYDSETNIIETMGELADQITGRGRRTGNDFTQTNNKSMIEVKSDLPLKNFVVLVQGTDAELLDDMVFAENNRLTISRSAQIIEPDKIQAEIIDPPLTGSIYTVDNGKENISPGVYTLYFDKDVEINTSRTTNGKNDVIVLFDPAIDVRFTHYMNGIPIIADPAEGIHVGQQYSVSAELFVTGTDEKIDSGVLPDGSKITIEIENGDRHDSTEAWDGNAKIDNVENGEVSVSAVLSIPGYTENTRFRMVFEPNPNPLWEVEVLPNGGTEKVNAGNMPKYELKIRTDDQEKEKYIDFRIKNFNLIAPNAIEELFRTDLELDTDLNDFELDYTAGGDILRVYPGKVPEGTYQVSVFTKSRTELLAQVSVLVSESKWTAAVLEEGGTLNGVLNAKSNELRTGKKEKYIDFQVNIGNTPDQDIEEHYKNGDLKIETDLIFEGPEFPGNGVIRIYPVYDKTNQKGNLPADFSVGLQREMNGQKESLAGARVSVTASDFRVKVDPEDSPEISEAEFQKKPLEFVFTLFVDDAETDVNAYSQWDFRELNGKCEIKNEIKNGKWVVTVEYKNGMQPEEYEIAAFLEGNQLPDTAKFRIMPDKYEIFTDPESVVLKQSELSDGQRFEITLEREGTKDSPDKIDIVLKDQNGVVSDPNVLQISEDQTDPADLKRIIKVTGGLITDPKNYFIELKYGDAVREIPFEVKESGYIVTVTKDPQLEFETPQDMASNSEEFRFEITADGRPLTTDEVRQVTTISIVSDSPGDPGNQAAEVTPDGNGYNVRPNADPAWIPAQNDITYTISVSVPGQNPVTRTFFYHSLKYELKLINGDGRTIDAAELNSNRDGLTFQLYGNGRPLPKDEVPDLKFFTINVNASMKSVDLEKRINSDGSITVFPTSHLSKLPDLFERPLRRTGNMTVTLGYQTLDPTEDTGTIVLYCDRLKHIWPYLILLGSVILIILYITKKRFGIQSFMLYCPCEKSRSKLVGLSFVMPWPLYPPSLWSIIWPLSRHHEVTVNDHIRVRAGVGCAEVYIGEGTVARRVFCVLQPNEIPEIDYPSGRSFPEGKWVRIEEGMSFAVFTDDGDAVLYEYMPGKK